ncbi:MAG TPA: alpha/beta fold hydrolase [bacterium]|nr:alpha/beta fold hydrolase [bacterium]
MREIHPKENELLKKARGGAPAGDGECGFLRTDEGVRLFFNRWLPAGKAPTTVVVCLHGMGAHGSYFSPLADVLTPMGMAVYAVDHRGHGLSDGVKGDMPDGRKLVSDAVEFLKYAQSLHPGLPLFVAGESMGGAITIQVAMAESERLNGCIMLAPALQGAKKLTFGEIVRIPYWALLLLFNPGKNVVKTIGNESLVYQSRDYIDFEHTDQDHLQWVSLRYLLNLKKLMDRSRKWGPSEIKCPTLILQGGSDKVCAADAVKKFFSDMQVKDKTLRFYEKGYHCLLADPDAPDSRETIAEWIVKHS